MVVSKSRVDLGEGEMPELPDDFLRNKSRIVPQRDSAHRDACACDAWAPAMGAFVSLNQAADLCEGWHRSDYIDSVRRQSSCTIWLGTGQSANDAPVLAIGRSPQECSLQAGIKES